MPHWTLPLAYTCVAVVAAFVLPRIESALFPDVAIGVSVGSAVAVLSAIASGMMGLTAIIFSIAFVMVQFSAVSYSPRVALQFARDPMLFHALGMFSATFTYALAATAWVDRDGSGRVPALSWLLAVALVFASLIVFARLIQKLDELQITNTLRRIGDRGREVIETCLMAPRLEEAEAPVAEGPPLPPVTGALRHVGPPRSVQALDIAALVEAARGAGGVVVMGCAVGDTLVDGSVVLRLHGGVAAIPDEALRQAVRLGDGRTYEQDPKYAFRLLVDIAIKALSPAINDPTTAVQALDQIEDLLRRLARRDLGTGRIPDGQGALRLVVPMPDWEDYLSLAFDEIRMFGMTSVQVIRRLRWALNGLAEELGDDPRADAVRRYRRHLDRAVAASALDAEDQLSAGREDPQGLGLARAPSRAAAPAGGAEATR